MFGSFDPGKVIFGNSGSGAPYVPRTAPKSNLITARQQPGISQTGQPTGVLTPESVRASGPPAMYGPNQAWAQNLATYAGGQFARPGGTLSFNPLNPATFPGQPTGGGNAPVLGQPQSLLDMALGGQPFSWAAPQPSRDTQGNNIPAGQQGDLQAWMDQYLRGGRNQMMGAVS
jgi:hypothetical protein